MTSHNIANKKELFLTFCPKCNKYPYLSFPYGKQKEIYIDCDNCGYKNNETLHSYLDKLTAYTQDINTTKSNEELLFDSFCTKCKIYFSSSSKSITHQLHQVVSLSKNINTNSLSLQIEKGYYHINNYCNELMNKMINELNKEINQLKYSYDNFKSTNNDILKLVELMISNYNIDNQNYYLMRSLNQIRSINIYEYSEEPSVEGICNYYNNYLIISNEGNEKLKETNVIREHAESVYILLILQDGRLASCSWDKTIKIFDIKNNFHCDITIEHSESVNSICQLENGKLVSCSWDKTIKIFTLSNSSFHCDYTIQKAHSEWIYKIISLTKNRIASCSKEIKIWSSIYPYNLIKTLWENSKETKSIVQLKKKEILISGGSDSNIRIWRLDDYNIEKSIEGISCCGADSIIELEDNKIMVGGNKKITILDLTKYEVERVIENGELGEVYSLLLFRKEIILCGSSNGTLGIINKEKGKIHFNKNSHQSIIKSILYLNENQFFTCSRDKTIKLWNYQFS